MEMPEAVIAAVATYLADFDTGRPWVAWDSRFNCPEPDPGTRYYDIRDWYEIKEMARFAATCRMANNILKDELRDEWEDNKESYLAWQEEKEWHKLHPCPREWVCVQCDSRLSSAKGKGQPS